ncbi:MAG: hypothetical protein WCL04_07450 [Verrucomicrobiota bacterium]
MNEGGAVKRAWLKEWWEHNKAAILAKRYEQATWLSPEPHEAFAARVHQADEAYSKAEQAALAEFRAALATGNATRIRQASEAYAKVTQTDPSKYDFAQAAGQGAEPKTDAPLAAGMTSSPLLWLAGAAATLVVATLGWRIFRKK